MPFNSLIFHRLQSQEAKTAMIQVTARQIGVCYVWLQAAGVR